MTQPANAKEMQKALFTNLVLMLSSSAMQQMGQLADPAAGETDVNLEAAQVMIDMIDMLQTKMKGNLDPDEIALLSHTLSSLQMTYVEAAREKHSATAAEPPLTEEPVQSEPAVEVKGGDGKDAKFHKSYG